MANSSGQIAPCRAKIFIFASAGIGGVILCTALLRWHSADLLRFAVFIALATLASSLKVRLPGVDGTMSANFLFVLIGILELSLPEVLIMACGANLLQCSWNARHRASRIKIVFNVFSMTATAVAASFYTYHRLVPLLGNSIALRLIAASCAYFLANTLPVAAVIALTENKSFRKVWSECYFWSLPYYFAGAAIAGLVGVFSRRVGWGLSLFVLPVIYSIYRSYQLYLSRLEQEKEHAAEIGKLHERAVEALALAIQARDHPFHSDLHRVRSCAVEVGKALALPTPEMEALRTAALLYDIGTLAVPEHILRKPSRLTSEEFDRVKVHPIVGQQILEKVCFPYPVTGIIRSHHENWDGTGYPDGLKGDEIPLGARILSAVDCLVALTSEREYRKAVPPDEAVRHIAARSGAQFDPKVAEVLQQLYLDINARGAANLPAGETIHICTPSQASCAPAAGFERSAQGHACGEESYLTLIANARQEAHGIFELTNNLGNSLNLDETLSVFAVRVRNLVPYDALAIYIRNGDTLIPKYVSGEDCRILASMEIPVGEGVSGWVAEHKQSIVNANADVELVFARSNNTRGSLRSAMAVHLEGPSGPVGVLTLYKSQPDGFSKDHLRILMAVSSKLGLCAENALRYENVESSATTDYLTGLPNARSLFLHLDRELARCKRANRCLAVLVCDLDGFKGVNDRFGHVRGNSVLQSFARRLQAAFRSYDCVARMGGDEFVIVAPDLPKCAAEAKISQLQQLAREASRHICGEEVLSVSVGISCFPGDGVEAEELLTTADRKMYSLKQEHHEMMGRSYSCGIHKQH